NHIVIPVSTSEGIKNAILDTGNPAFTLFKDDSINRISILGLDFYLQSNPLVSIFKGVIDWDELSNLVKTEIHGIIGYDFFSNYNLLIDFKNSNISIIDNFEDSHFSIIKINLFMNVPVLKLKINDFELNAIFDTGAMHSIIHSKYSEYLDNKNETFEEYNPILGKFKANLYQGDVVIGDVLIKNSLIGCCAEYDLAMQMLSGFNIEGILGISTLKDKVIYLSYREQKLGIF
ncbi:MAG: hypothetical protein N3A00_03160, partial [Thermodesulfovibrio sp.]|nr:hypothetical protein [Thermodesulfovibrio sp.]